MIKRSWSYLFGSMVLITIFLTTSVQAITCESCHSSSNSSGGYIYDQPLISIIHDPFYSPGEEFDVELLIRPTPDYSISELNGEISIDGTTVVMVSASHSSGQIQDDRDMVASWTLRSTTEGEVTITIDFDYEVYFKHRRGIYSRYRGHRSEPSR